VLGLAALALGAACTQKGEGLVLVQLSSSQPIVRASVVVASPPGSSVLAVVTKDWPATQPLQVGVFVPKNVSGSVDVVACGFDAGGNLIASTPNDATTYTAVVQPGAATAPVAIALATGSDPALCNSLGGAGGNGGATGLGGATTTGGASGAAGGAMGGAGGAAGAPGTGGAAGAPGTGGAAGAGGKGGAAGSGGKGGTAGSGGKAGTAGGGGVAGGMAGAAGSGSWHGAAALDSDTTNNQLYPAVAVDPSGNAVVVYMLADEIWATYYNATTAQWSPPGAIDGRGNGWDGPSVAVDKNGNYLAVWNLDPSSSNRGTWQSTSSNGTTWSTPKSITQTMALFPVLAMNADGAAVVAWSDQLTDSNGNTTNQQATASIRSPTDGTWSVPTVLRAGDDDADRNCAVAIDGSGNAFVGWEQTDGSFYTDAGGDDYTSVWMRQYVSGVGGGWDAAALFENYNDGGAGDISIAANTRGDAIVTYYESVGNPAKDQLWERTYSAQSGAFDSQPTMVVQVGLLESIFSPTVTLDETGNATVAWAAQTSTGYQVYTSRTAVPAASWPAPTEMETDNAAMDDNPDDSTARVPDPIVHNDLAGNVTLIWRKRTGTRFDLYARRYSPSAANWSPQVLLETDMTNSVLLAPALGVGVNGTAVAAWSFDTLYQVWANVFN
jgi:hypothetical protein